MANVSLGWIALGFTEEGEETYDTTLSWVAIGTPRAIADTTLSWVALATPDTAGGDITSVQDTWIRGGLNVASTVSAWLEGYEGETALSTHPAWIYGAQGLINTRAAWLYGYSTPTGVCITLISSNGSFWKYFRVLQEGYDDGTWNRRESISHTLDGSLSHSLGSLYRTWSMIIRVRHTESEINYGSIADLKTFYGYNDVTGSPSTIVTLIDHHGNTAYVNIVGSLQGSFLGVQVEGGNAWLLYKIQLIEVA